MSNNDNAPDSSQDAAPAKERPVQKQQASNVEDIFILDSIFADPLAYLLSLPPAPSDLAGKCLFAFDANVLIALHKLESSGLEKIKLLLRDLAAADRLVVPKRALQEYLKNRTEAVKHLYEIVTRHGSEQGRFAPLDLPLFENNTHYQAINESSQQISQHRKAYNAGIEGLKAELKDWGWTDQVSSMLSELIKPQCVVSPDLSREDLIADCKRRTLLSFPPGYKDKTKVDLGIGDIVIWHSLIKVAKERALDLIFVCNEEKPDWVVSVQKDVLGPRSELCGEFFSKTSRQFSVVSLSRFLEMMKADDDVVDAIKKIEGEGGALRRRLENRVAILLDSIEGTVSYFVQNGPGDGPYKTIRNPSLPGLIDEFQGIWKDYAAASDDPELEDIMESIWTALVKIAKSMSRLEYIEARMKESGENEEKSLLEGCVEFLEHYRRWQHWIHA